MLGAGEALPSVEPALLKVLPPGIPVFRSFLESTGVVWAHDGKSLAKGSGVSLCWYCFARGIL